jgi:hypothetical protein
MVSKLLAPTNVQESFISFFLDFFVCFLCSPASIILPSCRPISDVSSDLTVEVGAANFALHKVRKI